MIDEYWTHRFYGYHSDELTYGAGKYVIAVCDECYKYRASKMNDYRDLCKSCACKHRKHSEETKHKISTHNKGKHHAPASDETKRKMVIAHTGFKHSEDTKQKMSKSAIGKKKPPITDETRKRMSISRKGKKMPPRTEEHRQHISAGKQGIPYEDWDGLASDGDYCPKFNDAKKEETRAKYDHRCFMCDKPQDENITKNGKQEKLCCHHTDLNKDAGCDDHEWKLVPLCKVCHGSAHTDPMKSRIDYLRADEGASQV